MARPDRDPDKPVVDAVEARAGRREGVARYVLGVGLALAVLALAVSYLVI